MCLLSKGKEGRKRKLAPKDKKERTNKAGYSRLMEKGHSIRQLRKRDPGALTVGEM